MRLLKKSMAILMAAVMVTTMTPISAEAASKKYVKSLTLSKKSITIEAGKTGTIKATVKVKGNVSKKVKVSLSKANKKVVKKVKVGKPNSKGVSKITFTAADVKAKASTTVKVVTAKKNSKGKKITKKVKVTVNPKTTEEASTTGTPTTEPATTETPTTETPTTEAPVYLSYEGYELDWADEFTGTELNRDNWNVELHEPGWVNAELQEYVDSEENIYIEDGKLVLNPVQTKNEDGTYSYTSGRVNTQNKKTYTYGMFEVKAKVPEGKGYLPAFWLMANDENIYGQWPRCGEIDIMEVLGDATDTLHGTIHYGHNSTDGHSQSQGTYVLDEGTFADSYHTFTCEWEPGKITWYVDGIKFYEENDWYTAMSDGTGTLSYPAPFDQPFYIILNLAVGGSWVGYPDDATFQAQPYMIDYVRVYQKEGGYDDSNVTAPEKEAVVIRDADAYGNYLINGDFSDAEDLTEAKDWQFKMANGGVGTTDLSAGNATVKTTNDGEVDYSIQLVQNDVPLIAGQTYVLSYDAYASADRQMIVASKAPNNGWYAYLNETVSLTTAKKTYTHEFTMTNTDDPACTVEFNMGAFGSTDTIVIDNVSLKLKDGKIDEAAREAINNPPKSVRADGNHIYNGEFQEGDKKLGYWTIPAGADVSVTSLDDGRRLKVVVPKDGKVTISQDGIPVVAESDYELSLDAEVPADGKIDIAFLGSTYSVTETTKGYSAEFKTPATMSSKDIAITFNGAGTYYLDNVRIVEDSLIKNGSFNAGYSGYEPYVYASDMATYGVDAISNANAMAYNISRTGDQAWYIQLKQTNVELENGQWYRLSLDAKSTINRKLMFAIQRDGSKHNDDWTPFSGEKIVDLTSDYETYSVEFKMTEPTDLEAVLSISMGAVSGIAIDDAHSIYIDNIILEKIDEPEMEEVVAGENMLTNPELANEAEGWTKSIASPATGEITVGDGSIEFDITNVGTEDWHAQLISQANLALEADAKYRVSFDASSTVERQIKANVMNSSYAWFGGATPTLTSTPQTVTFDVDMTDKENELGGALFISMGTMGDGTPTSKITLSNFSVVKLDGDAETPETPSEGEEGGTEETPETPSEGEEGGSEETPGVPAGTELITNGAFTENLDGWTNNIGNGKVELVDGKAVYTLTGAGTQYGTQAMFKNMTVENGATYTISFKVKSSVDRQIKWALMEDGTYAWQGGAVETLEAGVEKTITLDVTVKKDSSAMMLQLTFSPDSDMALEGLTGEHTITLDDVSIIKK